MRLRTGHQAAVPGTKHQARDAQSQKHAQRGLAGKAWTAIVAGLLLLFIVPMVVREPLASMLGPALKPVGLAALVIGVALLFLHYLLPRSAAADFDNNATAIPVVKTARQLAPSISNDFGRLEPARSLDRVPELPPANAAPERRREQEWSFAVLAAIEWRRFEAVCEAFYAQANLRTRSQSHGADGGVDIWLQSEHMERPRIVQCKHWLNKSVGVKEMREFLGVMTSYQLQSGSYVTSSTFTPDAVEFAKGNGISLQSGSDLLRQISLRTPDQQAALLAVAYEGEYWKPTCASCGTKTVQRERKRDGGSFWGCSNYPRCKSAFVLRTA